MSQNTLVRMTKQFEITSSPPHPCILRFSLKKKVKNRMILLLQSELLMPPPPCKFGKIVLQRLICITIAYRYVHP